MSDGVVHRNASLLLTGGLAVGALVTHQSLQYAVGAAIGIFVTPDMDVDAGMLTDLYIRRIGGKPLEMVWDLIWFIYRRGLKHGSLVSHGAVVGTLGRIGYLYALLILLPLTTYSFMIGNTSILAPTIQTHLAWFLQHTPVWVGLMAADLIHWILDLITVNNRLGVKISLK